jgi:hypothetical protein
MRSAGHNHPRVQAVHKHVGQNVPNILADLHQCVREWREFRDGTYVSGGKHLFRMPID